MTIKRKPWWLSLFTAQGTWVTISPNIYYPAGIDPQAFPTIIKHEEVHIDQQDQMGLYSWLFKYFTNKAFRFDQEVVAYRVQLLLTPDYQRPEFIKMIAGWLSGSMYFHCASYEEAVAALSKDLTS